MTITQAISRCDAAKPNQYIHSEKIRWLSSLDGMIFNEIIKAHEGADAVEFDGYTEETDSSTVLLVPEPYSDLYLYYMFSMIDFHNAEYARYNNSISMFNNAFENFAAHYNRRHPPLQNNSIRL
ncbi:MAG: hypothetical protein PHX02_01625 [Oscillospiraceae bacterium]|jgi:hypothetical protein|nr:hypothetical protein [Oscillospiraceae bacterium]